jgi:hypothetical protein
MKWTSQWQIRCPKCGWTTRLEELGGTRIGASREKRTLTRCPPCGRLRWVIVEPVPASPELVPANPPGGRGDEVAGE